MKTNMWKSTLREIKQSMGRFLAILAIVALGVGFFAGLKLTKPAMVQTTYDYLTEKQLFDYRLLSTLGFEQEDVDFFASKDLVRAAEGAFSFDILCRNKEDNEFVVKAHSLTGKVNGVELVAGRMPEAPDECVVDSNLYEASRIGETIRLSPDNDMEDMEHFAAREYTVTGIVQSSLYIQFERGNTSLGNGRLSGFIYLLPEGFAADYYTEVVIKFTEDYPLYSQEYKEFLREREADWEEWTRQAADRRLEALLTDARKEIADGEQELADQREEAQGELDRAKQELDDAAVELADGEQKINDAETELADGERTLAEKEQELADGLVTLAEEEQKLLDGEQELKDSIQIWEDENYKVESAKSVLGEKEKELEGHLALLEQQTAELEAAERDWAGQKELLDGKEEQLTLAEQETARQEGELNRQEAELDALEKQLKEAYGEVPEEYAAQIAQGREDIFGYRQQLEAGKAELAIGREQLTAGKEQLAAGKTAIEEGKAQLTAGREQLAAGKAQIEDGKKQLADGDRELGKAWQQILDAQDELAEGKEQLADARMELEDGRRQLEDARRELKDGRRELEESKQELADGRKEYEDGLREYQDAEKEFWSEITDAEEKLEDARREMEEVEEPDTYVLGRDTNVGYVCFENDSNIVEGIANIFPVFFFSVAALVCITTMNRMVEEQRTQIGVWKALGYGEGVIMGKYLFYSGSAAFLGCVIGFLAGTYLFPRVIWTAYGIMYRVDSLVYLFDWKMASVSLLVSLLCSMGTTWLSCRYELTRVAAELMRPKSPKAGKRVLLEYIPFIWKRMRFLHKVSFRNIFRYKKRFFMMVIGISGCTALLVTGFGIRDSIANVAAQQFDEIQVYDIGVTFSDPVNEKTDELLAEAGEDDVEGYLYVSEKTMDLVQDDRAKPVNLVMLQEEADITPFLKLHTVKDEKLAFPGEGEAILSHKIAETFDIHAGDSITLRDDQMHTMTVVVSGICKNFVYNYVYMGGDTYRTGMGAEPEFKTAYLNLKDDTQAGRVSTGLMKSEDVASVTLNADTKERFTTMMESLNLIVLVVILCAAGLAFIVLYNLTNINITERIREIATIKVLGFYRLETASYVFRENVALTLIGAGAGLILGHFLHLFVMNEINVDMVAFDIHVEPLSYVYSVALTFVFAWSVNLMMRGKLDHISMTESLKSVD